MVTRRHHPSLLSRTSSMGRTFEACTGSMRRASCWRSVGKGFGLHTRIAARGRTEESRYARHRMGPATSVQLVRGSRPCRRLCPGVTAGPTLTGSIFQAPTRVPQRQSSFELSSRLVRKWFMRTLICGAIWAPGASDRWMSLTKCLKSAGGGIACPVHRSPDLPGPPNSPGPPGTVSLTDRTVGV